MFRSTSRRRGDKTSRWHYTMQGKKNVNLAIRKLSRGTWPVSGRWNLNPPPPPPAPLQGSDPSNLECIHYLFDITQGLLLSILWQVYVPKNCFLRNSTVYANVDLGFSATPSQESVRNAPLAAKLASMGIFQPNVQAAARHCTLKVRCFRTSWKQFESLRLHCSLPSEYLDRH